jgi:hypothetical protein
MAMDLPFLREYDGEYCVGTRADGIHVGGSNSSAKKKRNIAMCVVLFFVRRLY